MRRPLPGPDVAVGLPPVADGLLDDLCEPARHLAEEFMAGVDQITRRVARRLLLRSQGAGADAQKGNDQGQGPQDCAHCVLHRVERSRPTFLRVSLE